VVWRTGLSGVPSDSVGAPGPYRSQATTLGKTQARSAIIHQTIWCATGLSGAPADNDYPTRNGRLCKVNSAATMPRSVKAGSQRGTGLSGVAPDCPVAQEDKAPTVDRAPNPNGWVTWRRTGH
jgi:hypothetical protein